MSSKNSNSITSFLKLFSGRVLLTIVCSVVFIMLTKTVCNIIILKAEEITFESLNGIINMLLLIVSNVITFYFSKDNGKDDKPKREKEDEWQINLKKVK